ncbi:porin family protein [Runella sp.]|uniref:porin family protein n=1 Tax=Runella sp. TaxID=1960881 RepID=UPI003D0E4F55
MKRVRNLLTAIAVTVVGLSTQAQVYIGARGGISLAKTTGNGGFIENFTGNLDYIVSGNGAIFLKVPIAGGLSFRPELGYKQSGAGLSSNNLLDLIGVNIPLGGSIKQRLTYIQAPMLLQYDFGDEDSPVQPYIVAGPTFNYLAAGKIVSRADLLLFQTQPTRTSIGLGTFNRFEVGAAGGAGLSFDLGSAKMFIEGCYERGLTRLYDTPIVRVPVHNQSFSVLAGFAIPFGQ